MQRLGLATAELTETRRQQTGTMKESVAKARAADYAGSIADLDKVVSGLAADELAKNLVSEWTRLSPKSRASTNILVLDNAARLIVNHQVRETLKREGVVAAEDTRLQILSPVGHSDQEKQYARFYSGGQVVKFNRDQIASGVSRDGEYRLVGLTRDEKGRQLVRLVDEQGRIHRWDPKTGRPSQVNVFHAEERGLAVGDRIQWRLVSHDLKLKNAQRGTVEKLDGALATIRWDRGKQAQEVDLSQYKTWDHGYGETVYSAQSKTYDRVYVLAPVASPLVHGQNYYTAITRASYGVKLWTEDPEKLVAKLEQRSGEKTSSLEGLGRLDRDRSHIFTARHGDRISQLREGQAYSRQMRREQKLERDIRRGDKGEHGIAGYLADNARSAFASLDTYLRSLLEGRLSEHSDCPSTARGVSSDDRKEVGRGIDR